MTVSCSSDLRLKSNIQDSKGALSWVDDMRVRDFTFKATGERKTGVVAQEVMLKHPEMVHQDAEGPYLVDEPTNAAIPLPFLNLFRFHAVMGYHPVPPYEPLSRKL